MRLTRKAVLAGLASFAVAGAAYAAETPRLHVLNIALPDGSVEQIRYRGDRPPVVVVRDAPGAIALAPADLWSMDFAPFAWLDRMAADLDRSAAVLMRQAELAASAPGTAPGLSLAGAGKLPPGTVSYSFVSTTTAEGTCSRSVEATSTGPNTPPKVVTHVSGNCPSSAAAPAQPGAAPAPAVAPAPAERRT